MRKSELESIQKFLISSLGKKENQDKVHLKMLYQEWPTIVGHQLAQRSYPYQIKGKELWVYADPGAWLQNLTLMSGMILKKINQWWGEERFSSLKVLGRRSQQKEETEEKIPIKKTGPEKRKYIPNPEEIRQAEHEIPVFQDEVLRKKAIEALSLLKAKERIAKEQSLPTCNQCGIGIEKGEIVCPICEADEKRKKREQARKQLRTFPWLSTKELAEWANLSLLEAREVKSILLGDLAKKVLPGEEMSEDGLILVMLITGRKPMELDEETVQTVWSRIQREVRQDILEKIEDKLKEEPSISWEEIQAYFPISQREYEIARRNVLSLWKKEVKAGREISPLGQKAAMLVTGHEIEIWEEERILGIWERIRKGGSYVFAYRPRKNGSVKKSDRHSRS